MTRSTGHAPPMRRERTVPSFAGARTLPPGGVLGRQLGTGGVPAAYPPRAPYLPGLEAGAKYSVPTTAPVLEGPQVLGPVALTTLRRPAGPASPRALPVLPCASPVSHDLATCTSSTACLGYLSPSHKPWPCADKTSARPRPPGAAASSWVAVSTAAAYSVQSTPCPAVPRAATLLRCGCLYLAGKVCAYQSITDKLPHGREYCQVGTSCGKPGRSTCPVLGTGKVSRYPRCPIPPPHILMRDPPLNASLVRRPRIVPRAAQPPMLLPPPNLCQSPSLPGRPGQVWMGMARRSSLAPRRAACVRRDRDGWSRFARLGCLVPSTGPRRALCL